MGPFCWCCLLRHISGGPAAGLESDVPAVLQNNYAHMSWFICIGCQAFIHLPLIRLREFCCGGGGVRISTPDVRSLMEYCSPLWAGAPASHLSRLHTVETCSVSICPSSTHILATQAKVYQYVLTCLSNMKYTYTSLCEP